MQATLASVETLHVPQHVVVETWRVLRELGREGNEGLVLWLGTVASSAVVMEAFTPPQASIRDESGVGYFVTSDTLFELNRALHRSGLRLLAQVHSHPADAYHSETDDAYPIVTVEGGFSIVVPSFAKGAPDPRECAFYRLRRSAWVELSAHEIERTIAWCSPGCGS